jgi:hypothetical protein
MVKAGATGLTVENDMLVIINLTYLAPGNAFRRDQKVPLSRSGSIIYTKVPCPIYRTLFFWLLAWPTWLQQTFGAIWTRLLREMSHPLPLIDRTCQSALRKKEWLKYRNTEHPHNKSLCRTLHLKERIQRYTFRSRKRFPCGGSLLWGPGYGSNHNQGGHGRFRMSLYWMQSNDGNTFPRNLVFAGD